MVLWSNRLITVVAAETPSMGNRYGWIGEDGLLYLIRCPSCAKENALAWVSRGCCAWCGLEAKPVDFSDILANALPEAVGLDQSIKKT